MIKNSESYENRISILTPLERKFIYDIPKFTNLEKRHYFHLSDTKKNIVYNELRGISSRTYFIIQLGYFKASFRFFI